MGTHPIFESDFDCLTEHKNMNQNGADGAKTSSEINYLMHADTIYGVYFSKAKLKAIAQTSALLAGFAMVAMVEVALDATVKYPPELLIMFACITTLLVIVHLFSLMIATCVLPNIEAAIAIQKWTSSPHTEFRSQIEVAWILSTGIGLVLFLVEVALLIWIKFWSIMTPSVDMTVPANSTDPTPEMPNAKAAKLAAKIATFAFLVPGVIAFIYFGLSFYRKLADHATQTRAPEIEQLLNTADLLATDPFQDNQADDVSHASAYSFRSATEMKSV